MKKYVHVFFLLVFFAACKKKDDDHNVYNAPNNVNTSTFSIDINGRLFFMDSVHATLTIDTTTYSRPARWYCFTASTNEILKAGFIDTSSERGIPVKTFYLGDSVSAWFDYSRITAFDTIEHCIMLSARFEITSSDSINQKISAEFDSQLLDTISGDTITVDGEFGNFRYEIQ